MVGHKGSVWGLWGKEERREGYREVDGCMEGQMDRQTDTSYSCGGPCKPGREFF